MLEHGIRRRGKQASHLQNAAAGGEYSSSDDVSLADTVSMVERDSLGDRVSTAEDDSSSDEEMTYEFMKEFLSKQGIVLLGLTRFIYLAKTFSIQSYVMLRFF